MDSQNNAVATQQQAPTVIGLADSQSFDLIQRVAKCLSMSTLVPKAFQGNLPNCIIALNMAGRMNADPLMVCQNLYVVHGNPSWSAQFLIATFNKCGRFSSIRYDFEGTNDQMGDDWGCRATAVELSTGEQLTGPRVTIGLAKKEGWYQKGGSKWQTMPEQMLRYRAAAWFVRTIAPEIAMGLQTTDEIHDTYDMEPQGRNTYAMAARGTADDLNEIIDATPAPTVNETLTVETAPEAAAEQPAEQQSKPKRPTAAEREQRRNMLLQRIESEGLDLEVAEAAVNAFARDWTTAKMDKVEFEIIPNMLAEAAGV